jgi:putative intracellular protease/amidase
VRISWKVVHHCSASFFARLLVHDEGKPGVEHGKQYTARCASRGIPDVSSLTLRKRVKVTIVMPWRVEDALKERGANYVQAGLFKPFAIRDGQLITEQQQYSGRKVAQLVIAALGQ